MASTETQPRRLAPPQATRPRDRDARRDAGALRRRCSRASPTRQAAYAERVAAALADVADVDAGAAGQGPRRHRARVRELEARGVDGLLVVMLTYGPAMRVARALAQTPLPVCLANIQPVPAVTPAWDMGDLTYNQGIHGAQDTANAMVRAGRPFTVVTDDWHSDAFRDAVGAWARAAAAVTRWRELRVGGVRLRDERHGRHPRRRARAAAGARPAGRRARAGRAAPRRRGGSRGRGRRADRGRGRAVRGRPAVERERARRPRADAARRSSGCCATAATAPTRRTSARSPRTAASGACRWPPPRA